MWPIAFDFIMGASILLIPLIILIFVIDIDLNSKERNLIRKFLNAMSYLL